MIFHRITSFLLTALIGAGYFYLIFDPFTTDAVTHRFYVPFVMAGVFVLAWLLLARLLKWELRSFSFWIFISVPLFVLFSSFTLFLFLELFAVKVILGAITMVAAWLYTENLFTFYHLPRAYQAYSLEYLSVILYLLGCFLFASTAYGAQLFLSLPIWVPVIAIFWIVLFATIGVFWVSKVDPQTSTLYAVAGAIMLSEFYLVFGMLPTSFLTNAAALTVVLYLFFGLSRAHVLEKLTKTVLVRYLAISTVFLLVIFLTARWI
ncbi:MAG: hypothetical protein WCT24_03770 [Patescibacteria group bacterium]|jgi:hypothetical protein